MNKVILVEKQGTEQKRQIVQGKTEEQLHEAVVKIITNLSVSTENTVTVKSIYEIDLDRHVFTELEVIFDGVLRLRPKEL